MDVVKDDAPKGAPKKKTSQDKRNDALKKIIDTAEAKLKALGVQYSLIAIDNNAEDPEGGNVFYSQDITGKNFINVLNVGLKTKEDLIAMGVHVARLMQHREREIKMKLKGSPVAKAVAAASRNKKGFRKH